MNVEIAETVNLGARSVGLSRIHFSDDPQRKRSKNNETYFYTEKGGEQYIEETYGGNTETCRKMLISQIQMVEDIEANLMI